MTAGVDTLHVRDEKAQNTDAGASVGGTAQTRTLNTVVTNEIAGASLSANQITLPAGTYFIHALAPVHGNVDRHATHLYNVTDAAIEVLGLNVDNFTGSSSPVAPLQGVFTIAAEKDFELRHYTQTSVATLGLGRASNLGVEYYADVIIEKLS